MEGPKREPDLKRGNSKFWFYPEWIQAEADYSCNIILHNNKIYQNEVVDGQNYVDAIQEAYQARKKKIDDELNNILLGNIDVIVPWFEVHGISYS